MIYYEFLKFLQNQHKQVPGALFLWVYDSADRPFTFVELLHAAPDANWTEELARVSRFLVGGVVAGVGEMVGKPHGTRAYSRGRSARPEVARDVLAMRARWRRWLRPVLRRARWWIGTASASTACRRWRQKLVVVVAQREGVQRPKNMVAAVDLTRPWRWHWHCVKERARMSRRGRWRVEEHLEAAWCPHCARRGLGHAARRWGRAALHDGHAAISTNTWQALKWARWGVNLGQFRSEFGHEPKMKFVHLGLLYKLA
jgi:hypothetical protein